VQILHPLKLVSATGYRRGDCLVHVEPNVGPTPTDISLDVDKRPTRSWIHRSDQHRHLEDCDKRHGVQIQAS